MVPVPVPVIQKSDALIFRDRFQQSADLGIAVDRHLVREKRMGESEIRIVLSGVFFINDQIGNKVQHKPGIFTKTFSEHRHKLVFIKHLLDDDA